VSGVRSQVSGSAVPPWGCDFMNGVSFFPLCLLVR
jgi:hypothetical protein